MRTSETIKELAAALMRAQAKFTAVPKSGHNQAQNYAFADTDDYLSVARPVLLEHGLALFSSATEIADMPPKQTKGGAAVTCLRVQCVTRLMHTSGEWIEATSWGEGQDSGDKATYKAITGARKYGLALVLGLATGDDPDAERPRREREPRRVFTPGDSPAAPTPDAPTSDPLSEAQRERLEGWASDQRLPEKTREYIAVQVQRGLAAGAAGALIGRIKTKFAKELE